MASTKQSRANLSKSKSHLQLLTRSASIATFGYDDEDEINPRERIVMMDIFCWQDMGCPDVITVTIEPGDFLNG